MELNGFEPSRFSRTRGAAGGASPEWHDVRVLFPAKAELDEPESHVG
jgi:hypothetical protein